MLNNTPSLTKVASARPHFAQRHGGLPVAPPSTNVSEVPYCQLERITPDIALEWLTANTHNRPRKDQAIIRYARDQSTGRWLINSSGIGFSKAGVLIDGQNRLYACYESKTPFVTWVMRGLEDASQITTDRGVPRSLADGLHFYSITQASAVAAMTGNLWRYFNDPDHDIRVSRQPTDQEALAVLHEHPGLREFLLPGEQIRKLIGLRISVGGPLMYLTTNIDDEDASRFWGGLRTGSGLAPDSPILKLREVALADRQKRQIGVGENVNAWALTVKAWNLFRDGTPVRVLSWRRGGANPEGFPSPR